MSADEGMHSSRNQRAGSRGGPDSSYFRYDRSEEGWAKVATSLGPALGEGGPMGRDTYDNWRHYRMREPLKAIIEGEPEASWLTIGDGMFGSEANFLLKSGAKNVHCTDISDALLKLAGDAGFIASFSRENAEEISFADNSFDYVYCKEAFHHFPRPFVALYEMFRVARRGVILTEPRDLVIDTTPIQNFRNLIKSFVGREPSSKHGFEPIGNYAYALSEREVEKFLLGMHYTNVAFIGCNDFYDADIGDVSMKSEEPSDIKKISKAKRVIMYKDFICRVGVRRSTILTAGLFKSEISAGMRRALLEWGWRVKSLPINPHL